MLQDLIPTSDDRPKNLISDEYIHLCASSGQSTNELFYFNKALKCPYLSVSDEKIFQFLQNQHRKLAPGVHKKLKGVFEKNITYEYYYDYTTRFLMAYQSKLSLTRIEEYKPLIPQENLKQIAKAKKSEWFDNIFIATYKFDYAPKPDPIAFGYIPNWNGLFFITQWDNDLLLGDIISCKHSFRMQISNNRH